MVASVAKWSKTAASNSSADPDINWAEGQAPSTVNDSARGIMQGVACWRDDLNGTLVTTGGGGSYAIAATNSVYATLTDGLRVRFRAGHTNTTASTLQIDALTAKPLRKSSGVALMANDLVSGAIYEAQYVSGSDEFRLLSTVAYHPGVAKAFGVFTVDSGGTVTVQKSFNVTSITRSSDTFTVTLTTAMSDALYAIVATHLSHLGRFITAGGRATGSFTLKAWDTATTTLTADFTCSFSVYDL